MLSVRNNSDIIVLYNIIDWLRSLTYINPQQMETGKSSFFERYGVAVISAGVSLCRRVFLSPLLETEVPFITIFPAIAAAALYAGFRSGLATTILATVVVNFMVMPPAYTIGFANSAQVAQVFLFVVLGTFISWVAAERRRVQTKLKH